MNIKAFTFHFLFGLFKLLFVNSFQSLLFLLLSFSLSQSSCFNIMKIYLNKETMILFKVIVHTKMNNLFTKEFLVPIDLHSIFFHKTEVNGHQQLFGYPSLLLNIFVCVK